MSGAGAGIWRFDRQDLRPILLILALPLLVALPQLLWLHADPMLYAGGMAQGFERGILRGFPYIDPNSGFGTQALGHRAALDWLQGQVPWWNYFTGVGMPLAAEYQPGAFFPLTFLLLLPKGMVLQQAALHALSGLGTYGLLRQMGQGRFASTTGGVLYSFNGTLSWLSHATATAVPFLPWMLWGVERVHASVAAGLPGGWKLLALAMAMGLLCAFPETSYLSGLLALAWAVLRGIQAERAHRSAYSLRIMLGGVVGIAIAAPQVYAFFHLLLHAYVGGHGTEFAHAAFGWAALAPSLVAPYVYGPIFGYSAGGLSDLWGGIGGYVTVIMVVVAVYGFWARRDAIGWLLLGWCLLSLGKTFGVEPAVTVLNLVPGVTFAAFYRYAPPSWELAIVILAVRGLDHLVHQQRASRAPLWASGIALLTALAIGFASVWLLWPLLRDSHGMRNAALGSMAWATLVGVAGWWLIATAATRRSVHALAVVLALDSILMTFIPTLSNPRGGAIDTAAIGFLRDNLGMQRFFTLGPIQPNYGAYFGIASINHNYLPVAKRWVDWVQANLDKHADQVVFNGNYARKPGEATQAEELQRNLAAYEWAGVKYVVAPGDDNPLPMHPAVKRVYADGTMSIYELPGTKPYFESEAGLCSIATMERASATVDCSAPDTLVRRELHFPGWEATVGGQRAPISEYKTLFQSVAVQAGKSEVRFEYAPPHVGWAWLAALIGVLALALPTVTRARRSAPRNRSAT